MVQLKWLATVVLFFIAVQPSFSDDRAPILGIWRLVSYEVETQATGQREPVLGKTATGNIIFTPEGRMVVVLTGEGRKAPTTDQDRTDLFKSMVAYTGMYRVDGDKWITKVDVAANPAWVGTEQARFFRVDGNRLQESTAVMQWAARPEKGMVRFILTWERANTSGSDKIKTMLLRPAGWRAEWRGPGGSGQSEQIYEARGEKVVVRIQILTPYVMSCENDVTITSDGIKHHGCRQPDFALLFDPNDHDYPFKGKNPTGYEMKLKAK